MEHEILVVSLGPDDGGLLTRASLEAMRGAGRLILRTGRHAVTDILRQEGIAYETLDSLYDRSEDFEELVSLACRRLIRAAGEARLCYAVSEPASDATVRALARALPEGTSMRVLGGVSLGVNAACSALALGIDTENLRTVTALSLNELRPHADVPMVITELNDRTLASEVKLWLSDLFDDEQEICFLENAADAGCQGKLIPLFELDRQPFYDHRTAVLVPEVSYMNRRRADFDDLMQVVNRLRDPGGCPWDRQQTHQTLRRYLIEEACEAADALNGEDPEKMADELGDVLLQVALNSRIGAEHRAFTDRDVTSAVVRKMIRRHPHVFGDVHVSGAEAVNSVWEQAKKQENGELTARQQMEEVSAELPALMRAQKVQKRQRRALGQPLDAGKERQALSELLSGPLTEESLGAALEHLCNLAEEAGLDAETALRGAVGRRIESQM